jgi:ribokinase
MILVDAGANKTAAFTAQGAAGPSIFLTQLETPIASAAAMFSTARDGDLRVLNAAPAVAEARSLFPFAEVIIVNEGELAFYAEAAAGPGADLESQARRLLTRSDQTVIVTLGEAGALIVTPEGKESVPGRQVRAVDTTGAGDCFTGVLAAALAEGQSLKEAAAAANLAASLSVQRLGATASPSRSELERAARG